MSSMSFAAMRAVLDGRVPGRTRGDGHEPPADQPAGVRHLPDTAPADGQRELPSQWNIVHVADRLEEAFVTLGRLPARIWPKQFGNAMPTVVHDFADQMAQLETGQYFRELRERNLVRRVPTPAQIRRMEEALHWPLGYLRDRPDQARCVLLGALWANAKADMRKKAYERGIAGFQRKRLEGLTVIAAALVRDRVPVT